MSKYNNRISRSRSSERHRDENDERYKYEEMKRNKEEEIDRKIERIKDDERKREREWEKEKQEFLKRENDLLWEIERMKKQEQKYTQFNQGRGRFERPNYERRGFQTFNPRQGQFYNFRANNPNFNNQRNNNYTPTNKPSTLGLDKLISNIDKNNNNNNNNEAQKFRHKIYLPQIKGVNLVGLLIGPNGVFQKLLEEKTGCKIYINGKNVKRRGAFVVPHDKDRAHVLIIGYTQEKVRNATQHLEKIIYADEETRNQIIREESKVLQKTDEKNETTKPDDYLMTPYGPPGEKARFYKVPNDLVGLIIGANGETIRKIAVDSNCKIQAALAPIPNTQLRYVFIEGNEENYQTAVKMIEKVIGDNANRK